MNDLRRRLWSGKQYGYEALFKGQDRRVKGKPGVILAEIGMPEGYEFKFYHDYIHHVFQYSLPAFVRPIVLADRGIALVDPDNALAREPFRPATLVDAFGSSANRTGRPYVECEVTWRPPGTPKNPWDSGYFLFRGDGKGGAPDVCQKTGAKVAGWYFGRLLPEKRVAWRHQLRCIYEEAVPRLKAKRGDAEFRLAYYSDPSSMAAAVEGLLASGCGTIIYLAMSNPIYSDFEEYAFALPMLHRLVGGRARVICADQPGNQAGMREAFVQLVSDRLAQIPLDASVLVILSKHGHPFKKETQDARAPLYRQPLEAGVRELLKGRPARWDVVWSCDEYADDHWDPEKTKLDTYDAYRRAIDEEFDYAIEAPTEFHAENTDLMILHAMKKFRAFAEYDRNAPVPYPDWEAPLVRTYHERKTTGIYAGCPVGPYRRYVVDAVVGSVGELLDQEGVHV